MARNGREQLGLFDDHALDCREDIAARYCVGIKEVIHGRVEVSYMPAKTADEAVLIAKTAWATNKIRSCIYQRNRRREWELIATSDDFK